MFSNNKSYMNKKTFKNFLISSLIILVIIILFKIENKYIDIIKNTIINDTELSEEVREEIMSKTFNTSEMNFCKGYVERERGNVEESEKYFDEAIKKINIKENKFIRFYINSERGKEILKNHGDIEEAKRYTKKALDEIVITKSNDDYKLIWSALEDYIEYDGGRRYITNILETEVRKTNYDEARFYLSKYLAPIYVILGENTKAMKTYLYVIDIARENGNKYDEAKSLIDIGIIFNTLGSYAIAEENILQALKIPLEGEQKNDILLYGACELGRIYVNTNKIYKNHGLEKIPSIVDNIYSLEGFINNKVYIDFLYTGKILEAYYEMNNGNFEVAYKLLEEAKFIYEKYPDITFTDVDIEIKLAFADLEASVGNFKLAEALYIELEEDVKSRNAEQFELPIISSIANMYFKSGETEKFIEKVEELSNYLMSLRNNIAKTYYKANIDEYNAEKTMKRENTLKVINISIISVIMSVLIVFLAVILKKVKELKHENRHDGLTNALNRRQFNKAISSLQKKNQDFILIMYDIDDFKKINDTFGHEFGDFVLKRTTKEVKYFIGDNINIYRYGGEEFIIIIEDNIMHSGVNIAEGVRTVVENLVFREDLRVTISVGVASSTDNRENVLEKTDYNLYKSKNTGKNRVTY